MEITNNRVEEKANSLEDKIGNLEQTIQRVKELKEQGKTIVYIEGVFDFCHTGHTRLINFAHNQGDAVVVGVASDEYAATKGPGKPAFGIESRAEFLSNFQHVDLVLKLENPASKPDSDDGNKYLKMVTDEIKPTIIVASTTTDTSPEAKMKRAESCGAKFIPFDAPRPTPLSSSSSIRKALELLS